jgi:hypothetical protein
MYQLIGALTMPVLLLEKRNLFTFEYVNKMTGLTRVSAKTRVEQISDFERPKMGK